MKDFSFSDLILAFLLGMILMTIFAATSKELVGVDGKKFLTVEYKGENYRLQPLEDQP